MQLKRLALLAGAFLILGALYYIIERPTESGKKEAPPLLFPEFKKEQAASITLRAPDKPVFQFTKTGTKSWTVAADNETFSADTSAVNKMLSAVGSLRSDTVASQNPDNFDNFEVTGEKGVEVLIEDSSGNQLAHFFIGKNGPDIFSTYIRRHDRNRVMLAAGIVKNDFNKKIEGWRDKTIFSIDTKTIKKMTVTGDKALQLAKADNGTWEVTGPETFTANQDEAGKAVQAFARLEAAGFAKGSPEEFGLDRPVRTMSALCSGGTTYTLEMGKEKNAYQRYCRIAGEKTVYLVEKHQLKKICPELSTLKQTEEPAPDADSPESDNRSGDA
jgi:hypothetical protein